MDKGDLYEGRVSSEPCKPTTSDCARYTHFVRRRNAETRSVVVPVRFTDVERDSVKKGASIRKLSMSAFIRTVVTGRKLPTPVSSEVNRATYQELGRIGNNLNQLVRAIHSGLVTVVDRDLLQQLRLEIRNLGVQLLQGHA